MNNNLCIFANFQINTKVRFERMMDSFNSFSNINSDNWVVNIRGSLKEEAGDFLQKKLNKRLILHSLESKKGWFHDSQLMLKGIKSKYVLFWIEDHLCMCGADKVDDVVISMIESKVDYLDYSWFGDGKYINEYDGISMEDRKKIFLVNYTKRNHQIRNNNVKKNLIQPGGIGIISMASITSFDLFSQIISRRDPIWRRYSKYCPFDFEKNSKDTHWLPLKIGVPKIELFACIDDGNRYKNSSLIERGIYTKNMELSVINNNSKLIQKMSIIYNNNRLLNYIIKPFKNKLLQIVNIVLTRLNQIKYQL